MFPHSLVPWWDLCGCVVFCFCFWFFWLTVFIADIHFALFLHLMLYYFLSASSIFRSTWMSVCRIYSKRSQFKKKATAFLSIAKWCSSKNLQKKQECQFPEDFSCFSPTICLLLLEMLNSFHSLEPSVLSHFWAFTGYALFLD